MYITTAVAFASTVTATIYITSKFRGNMALNISCREQGQKKNVGHHVLLASSQGLLLSHDGKQDAGLDDHFRMLM